MILITGIAGFIGAHLAVKLAASNPDVPMIGVDNLNAYYDPALKLRRLEWVKAHVPNLIFWEMDVVDAAAFKTLFQTYQPQTVYHLAAQAGVRYSLESPQSYVDSNITGFLSVLEACRAHPPQHLLYASSSSVYGLNRTVPFTEEHSTDQPASLYGASKKANELMGHTYAHLFGIPSTALRFFTVYGEWGRPDMAYYKFTKAMLTGTPIDVYNHGQLQRDFTYIDDIIYGLEHLAPLAPKGDIPHRVLNIGNSQPVSLMDFIHTLEDVCGTKAVLNFLPMQAGDVMATWADCSKLEALVGTLPHTALREGLVRFMDWYRTLP